MARAMVDALARSGLDGVRRGLRQRARHRHAAERSVEARALREVFGAEGLLVSSTKSMIGHTMAAAGSLEAMATVLALVHAILPPTAHLDSSRSGGGVRLHPAPGAPRRGRARHLQLLWLRRPEREPPVPARRRMNLPEAHRRVAITGRGGRRHAVDRRLGRAGRRARGPAVRRGGTSPRMRWPARWTGLDTRRLSRVCQLAVAAARLALRDAGGDADAALGVVVGTELGDLRSTREFADGYRARGAAGTLGAALSQHRDEHHGRGHLDRPAGARARR